MHHGPSGRRISRSARVTTGGVVLVVMAGLLTTIAASPAGAVTIGAPSNATARAGNEDESDVVAVDIDRVIARPSDADLELAG